MANKFYKIKNRKRNSTPIMSERAIDVLKTMPSFKLDYEVLYECDEDGKKIGEALNVEAKSSEEKKENKLIVKAAAKELSTEEIFNIKENGKKKK